jgi:DNA-binding XRE family transcriptional regulator/predicted RNase H-like HicB family nuclease
MKIQGSIWKEGKYWAVHCPALQADTQGKSRKDGLEMMKDWVQSMLDDPSYKVEVELTGDDSFSISVQDPSPIMALIVQRARASSGMTLDQLAKKLGLKSRSNAAHYETGKHAPSLAKAQDILDALGFDLEISVRRRA